MKLTLSNIISLIIIAGLLVLLGVQGCSKLSLKKDLAKEKKEREIITSLWQKLISTPPKVTVVTRTQTVISTVQVKPTPRPIPNNVPPDTLPHEGPPTRFTYEETYSIGDSITADWYAETTGTIDLFQIKKVTYPYTTTTIEKFIPPMPVDTAAIIKSKVKRSHWGFYLGGTGNSLKTMPDPQAGLFWSFKDKWGLQPGVRYDLLENRPSLSVNLLFYFR